MVKVLDDQISAKWPRKVECAKCKSKLEVYLADLSYDSWKVSGFHFDGTAVCEYKYTFKCPLCGTEANGNEVDEEDVPLAIREMLKDRR